MKKIYLAAIALFVSISVQGQIRYDSYLPTTNDWEIRRNGEHLEIREPEQSNKLWARFIDDQALHLSGTPNLYVDGKVGIGTTSPTANLHISSEIPRIRLTYNMTYGRGTYSIAGDGEGLYFYQGETNLLHLISNGSSIKSPFSVIDGNSRIYLNKDEIRFRNNSTARNVFTVTNAGHVTAENITAKELQVHGTSGINFKVKTNGYVYARQIEVMGSGAFPDYVFNEDYQLMPLVEVEKYIKVNHHLPEVPSAAEVDKNGINLGQMNEILLKKIEELTLYVIEQDKKIKELQNHLTQQK